MTAHNTSQLEMTPAEFRRLGYQAVDMIADELVRLQNRSIPARQAVPDDLRKQLLNQPLPEEGESPDILLDFISENVIPYPLGHNHPRFFAWVNSPAAPISILGELLAAGMNAHINKPINPAELFAGLAEIGNDPWPYSSRRTPTLVFEGVQFSGA